MTRSAMPRRRLRAAGGLASALALMVVGAVALGSPSAVATTAGVNATPAGVANGGVLRMFSPKYMDRGGVPTRAQALQDAANYDLITAHSADYRAYVRDMKAVNPRLKIVTYLDATFSKGGQSLPETWYLRTTSGAKIKHSLYNTWLMDPRNSGWVSNRAAECKSRLADSGYDGCVLDDMGAAPVSAKGYVTGTPINPATRKPYTVSEWLSATTTLASTVQSSVSPKLIWGNGIGGGTQYFSSPSSAVWLPTLSGGLGEGFLRTGRSPIGDYPSTTAWKQNVDMLVDAGAKGDPLAMITKTWTTATMAQKDSWHRFALSSFLLGASSTSSFYFTYDQYQNQSAWHPYWDTALGAPSGSYYARTGGAYQRDFAAGTAVVNPTSSSVSVTLKQSGRTLTGVTTRTLNLPPHSGDVVRW